ncbi:hypothetical protein F4820DRAFT_201713 [Hypoxylon rubiginosum]|uniref:Uncharacterized protein n=1 Tax=Hypoxylon rubiginosum TaxID=110542 RepID=A0ACB9Z7L2_9PEZI|nr:hypothetical protein F4820DRAFT_201713 [Hypoxylon rubiginosum]
MFSRRRWSFSSATRHSESSKHHRDKDRDRGRRRRHSKHRDPSPEGRFIELLDLDYTLTGRQYVQARIKDAIQLSHVVEFLKTKFPDGDQQIPDDAEVQFFWDARRLGGNDIPKEAVTLRYRILRAGDDGSLRIIPRGANLKLRKSQLATIASEVAAGRSVGSIRETIAELLRVSNKAAKYPVQTPNQIVIEAAGGLRPGPLPGNNWEACKVQTWLCRYLTVDMRQPTNYVVLRGFNEQYVWHKPYVNSRGYVDVYELKQWLKQSVLTSPLVHSRGEHRRGIGVGVDVDDIRLTCRGKVVGKHAHVRPGRTVDFDVPRVVEDKFIQAEAWLVPLSETCIVCSDEKRVSEMPNKRRITASCEHDATICKECVGQWIVSSMDTMTWDRLKCPDCPQLLKYENVRAFAPRDTFDRYDTLSAKALLGSIPDFMWCLNPKCSSGQIHPAGCSRAKCHGCKHSLCVRHHVPWHSGETCDEYERRTRRQRRNDKASEKHVKEITKPCPGCKRNVNKFIGCDHVTCICGHEWCWLCFGRYYRDEHEFLQCHHTQQCRYHDNPPNYEGGRAFMPFLNPGGPHGPFMNGALHRM